MQLEPSPTSLVELAGMRLAKLRAALERSENDALLLFSPENFLYASGYESMPAAINRRYVYCAAVTPDRLLLVVPAADFAAAIASGVPATDIITFGTFYFSGETNSAHIDPQNADFAGALDKALSALAARRVGIDVDHAPAVAFDILDRRGIIHSDAVSFMLAVRSTKLPGEIALMRYAARITEAAIEAGMAMARAGITDKEVAAVVAATMSRGGGYPRNVTVVGGLDSALADAFAAERPLAAGDLLRFDVGCSYYGYKSDLARTAVVGEPTRVQARRYEALRIGLQAEIDRARAGVAAKDIYEAGMDAVEAAGFEGFRRHHLGHAIGLAVYEAPVITATSQAVLEAGSTFCFETPYYEPGWGGMMCEDTGVVTEAGFELISSMDRSLRVLN
ncbi:MULTISPECIES: M24 family metallopeptidase [Chelativorans]|jgi:Xaa-Pro aminopeptidase|nr:MULTISPECIES: Xaa-Pro peptidase family protein [Chelativorans]